MSQLFMMKPEEALTQLCHPADNNFTLYFKAPSYAAIDMGKLQQDFCAANVTILMNELTAFFNIDQVEQIVSEVS